MTLLYWLESIRCPALTAIMEAVTYLGDEIFFIIFALTVFWCVDKGEGYYLLFVGFFGTILNQFLKLLCRIPRPWVKDPNFTIVESAREGAGGYSFPSGHTQNVTGTLGGIARWQKRGWVRVICVALLLLTAFSRMYLGVHTPLDVGVSLIVGAALVLGFYPLVKKALENSRLMYGLIAVMLACATAFVLYANLTDFSGLGREAAENVYEGQKNSYSLLGALVGFLIAYPIERKYINFSVKGAWWQQILKVVLGLVGLLAVKEGLKLLFHAVGFTWLGANALRYCAVVLFAALVWPLVFPKEKK